MDPYSARRHALYQPKGHPEYDLDFSTASEPQQMSQLQQLQQLGEAQTSWYDASLGMDVPERTTQSFDGNIPFRPASQSAKRARVDSDETSIPLDVRTEVFALLSGASLEEFLEIRQFLKQPSQVPALNSKFVADLEFERMLIKDQDSATMFP